MTVTATLPTLKTEVAFASTASDSAPVWVDISAYVLPGRGISRGRSSELDTTETGTLTLRLRNVDGRFDPANPQSPYNLNGNKLLPMRQIRLTAILADGSISRRFTGFVLGWPQKWTMKGRYGEAQIKCVDVFRALAAYKFGRRYADMVIADNAYDYYRGNNVISLGTNSAANQILQQAAAPPPGAVKGSPQTGIRVAATTGPVASGGVTPSSYYQQYGVSAANFVFNTAIVGTVPYSVVGADTAYEMWFRPGSVPTDNSFVDLILNYNETWTTPTSPANLLGYLRLTFGAGGATYSIASNTATPTVASPLVLTAAAPPVAGRWDHWVITRTGSTFTVYQNAVAIATFACATGQALWQASQPGGASTNFTALWYGATQNKVSPYFHDVGEVAIYPANLTAAQVALRYATATAYAEFDVALPGVRVGQILDLIGWPAAARALDAGSVSLQATGSLAGQTALGQIQAIAQVELGNVFATGAGAVGFIDRNHNAGATPAFTFGDGPGEIPYLADIEVPFDEQRIINDWTITQLGSSPAVLSQVTDAVSAKTYFPRADTKTLPYASTADLATTAAYLLARTKDPHQRVDKLTLDIASNPDLLPAYAGLELGQFVRFRRRPPYAPAILIDCIVEQIVETADRNVLRLELSLSPKL